MNFRRLFLQIHLVIGVLAALVLICLGFTGGVLVFETEIDHWLNSSLVRIPPAGQKLSLNDLVKKLSENNSGAKVSSIILSGSDDIAYTVSLNGGVPPKSLTVYVNPYTAKVLGNFNEANPLMRKVHQFHTNFLIGEKGKWLAVIGAILLTPLAITGVIIWWPGKLLKMSGSPSGSRKNFELHNVAGFYSSIFMLVFSITGAIIHWDDSATKAVNRMAGVPETPNIPKPNPPKGAVPLGPDELVAAAQKVAPGAALSGILSLGNAKTAVRIAMKYPEDRTPLGRSNIYLDPCSAEILFAQPSRTASPGVRYIKLWNRQIHTGDTLGWPTRILAAVMSFTLPLLAITGPLIWLGKLRRKTNGSGSD